MGLPRLPEPGTEPWALLVFLKAPRPGLVKTRLAAVLGDTGAADLYRALAEETLQKTAPLDKEFSRFLFFTPPEAGDEMEAWLPGEALLAQEGLDLGARMEGAFERAFERGARRAVVIGSDIPALGRATVLEAFAALGEFDLVLGPARDGGYYLLGLNRPRPELFRDVSWSRPSVLATTLERAAALGLTVQTLSPLSDIDTPEDVRREWDGLTGLLDRHGLKESVGRALSSYYIL